MLSYKAKYMEHTTFWTMPMMLSYKAKT
jgi:hypothetical protein